MQWAFEAAPMPMFRASTVGRVGDVELHGERLAGGAAVVVVGAAREAFSSS